MFELVQHGGELLTYECGDDCRRRFVGSKSVVVSGRSDAGAQQVRVGVYRLDYIDKKDEELQVFTCAAAWLKQIYSRIGRKRPVVVLARSVHESKGLFVK